MTAVLGLSSYRWNNNIKSVLLLAAFPFLLMALAGGIFYVMGAMVEGQYQPGTPLGPEIFNSFGLQAPSPGRRSRKPGFCVPLPKNGSASATQRDGTGRLPICNRFVTG